jgi:hypothetical protein
MKIDMNRMFGVAAFALALCYPLNAGAVGNATGNPQALRHLVYSFTYGQTGDLTVHSDQGIGQPTAGGEATSGSGIVQDFNGSLHDQGTITVDIMREQPDTGLVVTISEQGIDTRKSDPATCVVYGTTNLICDPNKTINSEELTLLRFLGRNFIDPNRIDASGRWAYSDSSPAAATTSNYTITTGKNGTATIQETRVVKDLGARPVTTDITTTIEYNLANQVPTKVQEYSEQREFQGAQGMMKTTVQTTLTLASDSMAKQ